MLATRWRDKTCRELGGEITVKQTQLAHPSVAARFRVQTKLNYTPWIWSASELFRPSDRRLLAKLVPNLRIDGVVWSAQLIPTVVNLGFLDWRFSVYELKTYVI
jgi:hypothetical protein